MRFFEPSFKLEETVDYQALPSIGQFLSGDGNPDKFRVANLDDLRSRIALGPPASINQEAVVAPPPQY